MKGLFIYDNALDDDGVVVTDIIDGSLQGRDPSAIIAGCPDNQWGPNPYNVAETWVKIDLGSEQTIRAFGVVNHNFYAASMGYVAVGGNNDGGSGYTLVDTMSGLASTNHDPNTAIIFESAATYRYWRFNFSTSTSAHYLGGLYLARRVYEFTETPDAPFGEVQHSQIVSSITEGGDERRQVRGDPYYDRTLRWERTSAAVAKECLRMWLRQHGRSRCFFYVAHDKDQPTGDDNYIPEIVRYAGQTVQDLKPGSRYSILMSLAGLIRIDY